MCKAYIACKGSPYDNRKWIGRQVWFSLVDKDPGQSPRNVNTQRTIMHYVLREIPSAILHYATVSHKRHTKSMISTEIM